MINIEQIKKEVLRYIGNSPQLLQVAIMSKEIELNKHCKTITRVRGEFTSFHALIGHVVQGFNSKKFTPYTDTIFRKKTSKNFHQKVDFVIDPAEVLGSAIEAMYAENKSLEQSGISKFVIELLLQKIISDINVLSVSGKYDASKIGTDSPEFGYSMDGLNEIVKKGLEDTTNPFFLIPGNALTAVNILDEVTAFERNLPKQVKNQVKKIFLPAEKLEDYILAYEDKFGQNKFQNNAFRTRLGNRELVGIHGYTGAMFATVDNGLVKLVDLIDNPATITSVQEYNRSLKILGEFTLGYDFAVNELTFVHTENGSKQRGLNNAELNKLYYPEEKLTV